MISIPPKNIQKVPNFLRSSWLIFGISSLIIFNNKTYWWIPKPSGTSSRWTRKTSSSNPSSQRKAKSSKGSTPKWFLAPASTSSSRTNQKIESITETAGRTWNYPKYSQRSTNSSKYWDRTVRTFHLNFLTLPPKRNIATVWKNW